MSDEYYTLDQIVDDFDEDMKSVRDDDEDELEAAYKLRKLSERLIENLDALFNWYALDDSWKERIEAGFKLKP